MTTGNQGPRRPRSWVPILVVAACAAVWIAIWMVLFPSEWRLLLVSIAVVAAVVAIRQSFWSFGVGRVKAFLRNLTIWVQVLTFLLLYLVVGGAHGALVFYTVSAQLIPVLMLALVFQGSAFDLGRWEDEELLFVLITLVALIVGEGWALTAAFRGEPVGAGPIVGAIGAALVGIALHALVGRDKTTTKNE